MGILESLIQADEAGRQRFIGSLGRLNQQKQQDIATQKAQTIRNLGIKFMQQGNFTPEGMQAFAKENQVDIETMKELTGMVKQFQDFRDKKELKKVRVGEQEVAGAFDPYKGTFEGIASGEAFAPPSPREQAFQGLTPAEQKLAILGRGPAPTAKETEIKLMRKFAGFPEGSPEQAMYQKFIRGPSSTSELQTLVNLGKAPAGSVERQVFERRIAGAEDRPGEVSGKIFDDIAVAYKVTSLDRIDPITRTKLLHASELAETLIAEGVPRNKAINQAVISTEKQIEALEAIPRANPGNIFNNIDETRTSIQKALAANSLIEDVREVLSTQGWEPEEIETHFGDLLVEGGEQKPLEPAPSTETKGSPLTDKIIADLTKEFDGDMEQVKQAILNREYDYSKYKAGE
jgi:hypothetical protein